MAAFSSPPLWPPVPPAFGGLRAEMSKSRTIVQFAVGACMVFVQHLVEYLIGFGGMEAGRGLMIGNLVPALEGLLTAFGGTRLGIGSTPPVLLLGSGHRALIDNLLNATSIPQHNSEAITTYTFSAAGYILFAVLIGAWVIVRRALDTEIRADPATVIHGVALTPSKQNRQSSNVGLGTQDPAEHRHPDPQDDVASDSDDDSDDDDPPPPGPSSSLHYDDDGMNGNETPSWRFLGTNFLLGYLAGTVFKGLRKLKTKVAAQRRNVILGASEQIGGTDYNEWDVLQGTYGFSRSKSNVKTTSRSKSGPSTTNSLMETMTTFLLILRAALFNDDVTARPAGIPAAMNAASQNRTTWAAFSARHSKHKNWSENWSGMSKIRVILKKAMAQCKAVIVISLEKILEMFGLTDLVVLAVVPLIISILSRYNEPVHAEIEADDGPRESDHEPLTGADQVSMPSEGEPLCHAKRREDDEFEYFEERVSIPSDTPNGNNPEQADISTSWSSRESIETCATQYAELADFIVRHEHCKSNDLDGDKMNECGNTGELEILEAIDTELGGDTSRTKGGEDETLMVTELKPLRYEGVGEEFYACNTGHDSEKRTVADVEIIIDSVPHEKLEDVKVLPSDESNDSFATDEGSEVEMEVGKETHDRRVQDEPNRADMEGRSDSNVAQIVDRDKEDENDTLLFPGSFPAPFPLDPVWATRIDRMPGGIFAQFGDSVREEEALLVASEADDAKSILSTESLSDVNMCDVPRTPPQTSTKTLPNTPPAVPRGRKMRLKEKLLEVEKREAKEVGGQTSPISGLAGAGIDEAGCA